jgi:hypothetical protein
MEGRKERAGWSRNDRRAAWNSIAPVTEVLHGIYFYEWL